MEKKKLAIGGLIGLTVLGAGVWITGDVQRLQQEDRLATLKQEINDSLGPYADSGLSVSEKDNQIEVSSMNVSSANINYPGFARRVSEMSKATLQVLDENGEVLGEISVSDNKVSTDLSERETISWTSSDGLTGDLHTSKGTDINDTYVKHDVSPDDLLRMYPEVTPTPEPTATPEFSPTPKPTREPKASHNCA